MAEEKKYNLEFEGWSDDFVYVNVNGNLLDEFIVTPRKDHFIVWTQDGKGLKVTPIYDGTWSFAVGMIHEGFSVPEHQAIISEANSCSTKLTLIVGPKCEVEFKPN